MKLSRALAAEALGTFGLVFAGTGAIVVNALTGGQVTHVGVALTFGLIVLALIMALGDVSGAHFNPAVSIGFVVCGRFPAWRAGAYAMAQVFGAVMASLVLRSLFPEADTLGATAPLGSAMRAFWLEAILTAILMLVILGVSTGSKERGALAGLAIGATVTLEALFAGPITGASMNPARSLAPALVSLQTQSLWIYLVAPPLGAAVAAFGGRRLFAPAPGVHASPAIPPPGLTNPCQP